MNVDSLIAGATWLPLMENAALLRLHFVHSTACMRCCCLLELHVQISRSICDEPRRPCEKQKLNCLIELSLPAYEVLSPSHQSYHRCPAQFAARQEHASINFRWLCDSKLFFSECNAFLVTSTWTSLAKGARSHDASCTGTERPTAQEWPRSWRAQI
jgi:hypothetical protein